jgi:hypothetical protein
MHPNKLALLTLILAIALLSGCGSMPKTPELMIQNAKDGKMMSEKDVFEVKRPLSQVSAVFKKKANECLRQDVSNNMVVGSASGPRLNQRQVHALTPKVIVGKQHTRLTLQVKTTEGATELGDIPPDGWYMMVVDAYPVDKNSTRVESYYQYTSYHGAFTAVKLWANGTNMDCPDLTQ